MRLLVIFIIFMFTCTPEVHRKQEIPKSIHSKKIYLAPFINNAQLELLPGWPTDPKKEKQILKNFTNIHKQLKSSFENNECASNFSIVEDAAHPTMRISITIKSSHLYGDTLEIPLRIEVERLSDGMIKEYSLSSYAIADNKSIINLDDLFTILNRSFPYTSIVNLVCSY